MNGQVLGMHDCGHTHSCTIISVSIYVHTTGQRSSKTGKIDKIYCRSQSISLNNLTKASVNITTGQ